MKNLLFVALFTFFSIGLIAQSDILPPELDKPDNGAIDRMPDVELDWYAVNGIGQINYELQVDVDNQFENPIIYMTTTTAQKTENLQFGQVYYWKVRASDNTGTSNWSEVYSFTIFKRIDLKAPDNGTEDVMPDVKLSWKTIYGANNHLSGLSEIECQIDTSYYWRSEAINITNANLNDSYFFDENNGWVCGFGTVLKHDEFGWSPQPYQFSDNYAIYFANENKGWVAGHNGNFGYFNGLNWKGRDFNDIFLLNDNLGWSVGQNGSILNYNGSDWAEINSSTYNDLFSVFFINENNGWSVGDSGLILNYNGTNWANYPSPASSRLTSVYFLDENNGWAVGDIGKIIKYNGTEWIEETSPTYKNLYSLYILDENNGWAIGTDYESNESSILYYNGIEWVEQNNPTSDILLSITFVNENNGWLLSINEESFESSILHYNGSEWEVQINSSYWLTNLAFINENAGWAIGIGNIAMQYNGIEWINDSLPNEYNIRSISFTQENYGWAIGENGTFINYFENDWSEIGFNTYNNIYDLIYLDDNTAWAVGFEGTILKNYGSIWKSFESPTSNTLNGLYFFDENHGWAVGEGGIILNYDGNNWAEHTSPVTKDLHSIYFLDMTHGWACGKSGTLLFYDGNEWIELESGTSNDLFSIVMFNENEGWASGAEGIMVFFDGDEWIETTSGSLNSLNSIFPLGSNNAFIVGDNGTFISKNDLGFNSPAMEYIATSSDSTVIYTQNLYFAKDYFWRIRAIHDTDTSNWSSARYFSTIDEINLVSPVQNATNQDPDIKLSWMEISGIDSYIYQVCNNPQFTFPCITGFIDTNSVIIPNLFFGNTYYWRVKAIHFADTTSWSEVRNFEVINTVILSSPENGASNISLLPTLKWDYINGADQYQAIWNNEDYSYIDTAFTDTSLFVMFKPLELGEDYFWKVRAIKNGDTTNWSEEWQFHTGPQDIQYNLLSKENITVYPNPTSGQLNIEVNFLIETEIRITVMDLIGKALFNEYYTFYPGLESRTMNLDHLTNGIYLIRFHSGNMNYTQKLIINR